MRTARAPHRLAMPAYIQQPISDEHVNLSDSKPSSDGQCDVIDFIDFSVPPRVRQLHDGEEGQGGGGGPQW